MPTSRLDPTRDDGRPPFERLPTSGEPFPIIGFVGTLFRIVDRMVGDDRTSR